MKDINELLDCEQMIEPVVMELSNEIVDNLVFNSDGLIPAIAQDFRSGKVLMMAWMDKEALSKTCATGRMWYWSRSRKEYWCKGESSGDRQWVRRILVDCDQDVLLFEIEQEGRGACHTGQESCFYRNLSEAGRR